MVQLGQALHTQVALSSMVQSAGNAEAARVRVRVAFKSWKLWLPSPAILNPDGVVTANAGPVCSLARKVEVDCVVEGTRGESRKSRPRASGTRALACKELLGQASSLSTQTSSSSLRHTSSNLHIGRSYGHVHFTRMCRELASRDEPMSSSEMPSMIYSR